MTTLFPSGYFPVENLFQGEVTDVQLKYTKDKKFRHFGFVGFKTQAAAESAKNHFHNTFMGATKISVEFCADWGTSGGGDKPRAWSKYSSESSAYQKAAAKGMYVIQSHHITSYNLTVVFIKL